MEHMGNTFWCALRPVCPVHWTQPKFGWLGLPKLCSSYFVAWSTGNVVCERPQDESTSCHWSRPIWTRVHVGYRCCLYHEISLCWFIVCFTAWRFWSQCRGLLQTNTNELTRPTQTNEFMLHVLLSAWEEDMLSNQKDRIWPFSAMLVTCRGWIITMKKVTTFD